MYLGKSTQLFAPTEGVVKVIILEHEHAFVGHEHLERVDTSLLLLQGPSAGCLNAMHKNQLCERFLCDLTSVRTFISSATFSLHQVMAMWNE